MTCTGGRANNSPAVHEILAATTHAPTNLPKISTAIQRTVKPRATITTGTVGLLQEGNIRTHSLQYRKHFLHITASGNYLLLQFADIVIRCTHSNEKRATFTTKHLKLWHVKRQCHAERASALRRALLMFTVTSTVHS
jgi:hypothetical protein